MERKVLAAVAEDEFPHANCVENTEKALDESTVGWTFTDKPNVKDELEKDAMLELSEIEKVLEAVFDSFLAPIVMSSHDDWLHIENDTNNELMSRMEMRDEDLDFGFVSVDKAAGCLKVERYD